MNNKVIPVPTKEEVELFFNLQEKIRKHAKEVAKLCTDFGGRDELENIEQIMNGYVRLGVWNSECGPDCYDFPGEYLSMPVESVKQILEDKKRKERERRRAAAEKAKVKREVNRAKREAEKEAKERAEYERLKAKFESNN